MANESVYTICQIHGTHQKLFVSVCVKIDSCLIDMSVYLDEFDRNLTK